MPVSAWTEWTEATVDACVCLEQLLSGMGNDCLERALTGSNCPSCHPHDNSEEAQASDLHSRTSASSYIEQAEGKDH